jgi:hypothetical protein
MGRRPLESIGYGLRNSRLKGHFTGSRTLQWLALIDLTAMLGRPADQTQSNGCVWPSCVNVEGS